MGESVGTRRVSRRALLLGGLAAGGALFVAACGGATTTPAPTLPATPTLAPSGGTAAPGEAWGGTKLVGLTGAYMGPYLEIGLRIWKTTTGGDALFESFATNEKRTRVERVLEREDPYFDLVYTYDEFMVRYGARLLVPLAQHVRDTSDFVPSALRGLTTPDGELRGLPLYEAPYVWTWNKAQFAAIDADAEQPPDTWQGLFDLAPKWKAKGIVPAAQPWLGQGGSYAALFFKQIYNSLGHPLLSDDRTEVTFDGPEGLEAFETIEAGLKAGFWDAATLSLPSGHDAYALFGGGSVATAVWSESPAIPLPKDQQGIRQFPGIRAGTTGSVASADGMGINRFGRQQEAAASFMRTAWSAPVAREAALSALRYPVARISVITDPEVIAAQPLLVAYAAQTAGETNSWAAPYDYAPVFDEVVRGMVTGELDAAAAQAAAVDGVRAAIASWVQG